MKGLKSDITDEVLVRSSLQGDKNSLEELVRRHRDFVYNLSLKMTWNKDEAADITQEVFIKVITKLSTFQNNSSFSTWLYRITVNHILNERKAREGKRKMTFVQFGATLDNAPDMDLAADEHYAADALVLTEETKQTCMTGMLMCLDEKHRMVFILAELFGMKDDIGKEILATTKENFRMMLSRAKKDLYNFMQDKCGLINRDNPCRCEKKTRSFIKAGYVDPEHRLFTGKYRSTIEAAAGDKQRDLEDSLYDRYRSLFLQHHFLEGPDLLRALNDWLASEEVRRLFNFN
jgi:RNA polymerase sigma factor (sigma-70 family)